MGVAHEFLECGDPTSSQAQVIEEIIADLQELLDLANSSRCSKWDAMLRVAEKLAVLAMRFFDF